MITDTSYYQNQPLEIPNSASVPSISNDTPSNVSALDKAIQLYEYQLLFNALGAVQYADFMNQFKPAPNQTELKDDAEQKWVDLVNGKDLDNGRRWEGLRFNIGDNKVSLVAYFVYHQFKKNDETFYATTGEVKSESANAYNVSTDGILATRWNEFVTMYEGNQDWFYSYYHSIYWSWNWFDWHFNPNQVSMLDFMRSDTDAYDTSFFKSYKGSTNANRFGL